MQLVLQSRRCCRAACRYQSKKAAAAASDEMDPELRVVMLGGRDNEGASGMLQIKSRRRSCYAGNWAQTIVICCMMTLL